MANIKISDLPLTTGLDGTEDVPIVQGGTTKRTTIQGIADAFAGGQRLTLTKDLVLYVRTDGNDANTGLVDSPSGAFKTWTSAIDAASNYDANNFNITVQHGNEGAGVKTFNEDVFIFSSARWINVLYIKGSSSDAVTPSNLVIHGSGNFGAITNLAPLLTVTIQDMKLSDGGGGACINNWATDAIVNFTNVNFGLSGWQINIDAPAASVSPIGNYTVSGNGNGHVLLSAQTLFIYPGVTVTFTGAPNFSVAFVEADDLSRIFCYGANVFSGAVTGKRYNAINNAVINTSGGGANFFPGNAAGTTATGGQYV